jgi:hypothetical protein
MTRTELVALARNGAAVRLAAIDAEITMLRRTFSETTSGRPTATRRRRTMTPEARKRIATAQKKRWAAWRKEQNA